MSLLVATVLSVGGCIAQPIAGKVDLASTEYEYDSEVTRTSYASPAMFSPATYTSPGGFQCSATMIGPNLMMSAAHCNVQNPSATFGVYSNSGLLTEAFNCRILLNSFAKSDLALYHCYPNSSGISPGDKFGYLDLDLSEASNGQRLYSLWWNPVSSQQNAVKLLYSSGRVTSTTEKIWGIDWHNTVGPIHLPIGIGSDLWSNGGASGSSQINPLNNRILVGPMSTGSFDAPGRQALSIRTYMNASVDGSWADKYKEDVWNPGYVENSAVWAEVGLTPSEYKGLVDKNRNGLFDIQEDIEKLRGENARDWYWLGFESERRNALWTATSGSQFNTNQGLILDSAQDGQVAAHTRLNLKPNTAYRIQMITELTPASSDAGLRARVGLGSGIQVRGAGLHSVTWREQTGVRVLAPSLQIQTVGKLRVVIRGLIIVEEKATMNFDTSDKRQGWQREGGKRANILPQGRIGFQPDWAALVAGQSRSSYDGEWLLRNSVLALGPGTHSVCFDVRARKAPLFGPTNWGIFRVESNGHYNLVHTFPITTKWNKVCTPKFEVEKESATVSFHIAMRTLDRSRPAYFVDDIRIDAPQ